MGYFTQLKKELSTYLPKDQVQEVYKAYLFGRKAHEGQTRLSGEPYITHPIAAAHILAEMRMDYHSIMATILHDVLEDTDVSKADLLEKFGQEVADLVDGVSKLTQIQFASKAEAQAENFRKMFLAMAKDIRVILVKLADRLHNMRTIDVMPAHKKWRIATETLEIYAPIANRLGMHHISVEFQELGFKAKYPHRHEVLSRAIQKAQRNRKQLIKVVEKSLQKALKQHKLKVHDIFGRQKHLYSIYRKMRKKKASLAEVMDVYAFRVIVDSADDCYRTLGIIHSVYKPLPERFKDYIAIPKVNGYQSLHTTLFGPYGVPLEVQIRSKEMDQLAENGIAAHWIYKSKGLKADEAQVQAREWLKDLLEIQQSTGSSLEFIENVKVDLFPGEVYLFTPKGEIIKLPKGATPLDFAYAIHSDIGNSCIAVKVNRRLAPLFVPLVSGHTVDVITAPSASPKPEWLNYVVTGKARSSIRHYLKTQQHADHVSLGKLLLDQALATYSTSLQNLTTERIDAVVTKLNYETFDDLCAAISLGEQVAPVVASSFVSDEIAAEDTSGDKPVTIKGTEGLVLDFAECCRPIPGDPIVGFFTGGKGIVVHVESCGKVDHFRSHPESLVNMRWEENVKGDFRVDIWTQVVNERGVLAQMTSAISDENANIESIHADRTVDNYISFSITLGVRDRQHLAQVMRRLRNLKCVNRVTRLRS